MADTPNLEDLVEFPAAFTFRVVAEQQPDLASLCQRLVEETLDRPALATQETPSKNGRFRSVRITATVVDAEEIRSTYRALKQIEGLKLLL